ncbi:DUF2062 domain-containing protein [Shimazuella sp. AN120528]|uniref:DUF2062 domain-containing protein n=1 Tax=Shimazuella soli TaxID=1892854 RepID=UPI001F108D45|nr:DUF2062 domain-containing protein [Shimazuella soli]MCH5584951.1 DUF2062 domain-containing protein [Shimazuella soli]
MSEKKKKKKPNWFLQIPRAIRYNYLKLLRSPEGGKKVSLGFALGFGLEMIVLPTASLIYILFYPIVRICGGSFPASIIGNVIGKLTFLPVILLPFSKKIGELIYPTPYEDHVVKFHHIYYQLLHGDFRVVKDIFRGGLHILIGQTIFGFILGFASYFVIYYLYERQRKKKMVQED